MNRTVLICAIVAALVLAAHQVVVHLVDKMVNVSVEFGSELDELQSRESFTASVRRQEEAPALKDAAPLEEPQPFREVEAFDENAQDWSSFFDGYAPTGVLVFDANRDGRLDLYLSRNGNSWVRPTDSQGVLQDEPFPQFNNLYVNLGNDADGLPVFRAFGDLAAGNDSYVAEELLIENYLFPRQGVTDSRRRVGRSSSTAIAADLNNDGLPDLVVANLLPGMLWSHPKTQRVLDRFVRPVGRQAVNTKLPLQAQGLYFVHDYQAGDQIDETRESARGVEAYGANSVFINLGDRDGDGLPEWRDASRELGLEGRRNTLAVLASDFDLDGDLDIFEANIMDMDYWPGGATALAGARNQLYLNQLAETGQLSFLEKSAEMRVDGAYGPENPVPDYYRLYQIPLLPQVYSIALRRFVPYQPQFLEIDGKRSEPAQISWAAVAQDVDQDGYDDIWVANDLGFLRLYRNQQGRRFELSMDHPRAGQTGYWMSLSPGDFDQDLKEDLFVGNMGGATMNLAIPIPDLYMLFDPVMSSATMAQQFFGSSHHSMHTIIDGADFRRERETKVRHSRILPPDASLENNIRSFSVVDSNQVEFDPAGLDPYEFAWGSTPVDVQNDGRTDLYWIGCLQGRGGGIFSQMGTGPGRLLVNTTAGTSTLTFSDLTAEHHLFNILELRYDRLGTHGYIYRKSPLQNWGKRSLVYSHDVSVWGFQGPGIVERVKNHDLIQTAENGRATIAADLNDDGFADLIVRNIGGYDSRSSQAVNLKARVNGKVVVIPSHDANFPTPTNYEPGSTRLFVNTHSRNNWIKVELLDDSPETRNRDAIGARVIVNDRYLLVRRSGSGGFISNYAGPLLFGLGQESARWVEVAWPDRRRSVTRHSLPDYRRGTVTISKTRGVLGWKPESIDHVESVAKKSAQDLG